MCHQSRNRVNRNKVTPITTLLTVSTTTAYQQKLVLANGDVSGNHPSHYFLQDIPLCSVLTLLGTLPLSRLSLHHSPETNVHRRD